MLTKHEKRELLQDGRNAKRRQDFLKAKTLGSEPAPSLDGYVKFLTTVQKTFNTLSHSRKEVIERFKL